MSELLIANSFASEPGIDGLLAMIGPTAKPHSNGSHTGDALELSRTTPAFQPSASRQRTEACRPAVPELRAGQNSVLSFLMGVFHHDLNFKVRDLPSEYWNDAQELTTAFQNELLELVTPSAREAPLNETQMSYVRSVVAGTYNLDIHPQGMICSRCDQVQILAVATYLNSLR